ncbi:MAG: GNAT family N-acetyltransferase, partial [Bacteroidaceae bacterium]|nr:GNAT family N-acetyltransferase [Bacteroidaceae bacterium]
PYHVIHRIAVTAPGKGYAQKMFDWALGLTETIRIDTHRDNVIMHHILRKYGFIYCGVIYLANGEARDAYQLSKLKSESGERKTTCW